MGRPPFTRPVERPEDRSTREGNLRGEGDSTPTSVPSDDSWTEIFREDPVEDTGQVALLATNWSFPSGRPAETADFVMRTRVEDVSVPADALTVFLDWFQGRDNIPGGGYQFPDTGFDVVVEAKNNSGSSIDVTAGYWYRALQ